MTVEERTAWHRSAAGLDSPMHRAVAFTLRYAGLLRTEVAALNLPDVDLSPSPRLRVGTDVREVPVVDCLRDALRCWLHHRPRYTGHRDSPALFISPLGNRLLPQRINDVIWDVAAGGGLPHVRPVDLRRTYAVELIEAGYTGDQVAALLGGSVG